jgi:hypothetical protein
MQKSSLISITPSEKIGSSMLIYFTISFLFSLLVFSSGIDNYFASDDWPAILRNTTFSWQVLPNWFTELRAGWYRPVHDLFIYWCWWLFKLNPVGYRLVSIFVYALVSANVGLLMNVLTRDRRISIVSILLFSAFATHSEPVLWFAGTNELLAGLFVLISVISYILYRETNNYGLIVAAGISGFLAFASKETSLFFPILLIFYDLLLFLEIDPKKRRWSFFPPFLPITLLWIGFLLFRIPLGSSYSGVVSITLLGMVKNFVYYILIGIFVLPNNYAFLSSLSLWRSSPILPVTTLVLSASTIAILGFAWLHTGILAKKSYRKSLLFTLAWIITALGPVIFIVTERAVFLSSIGIASTFSILIVGAWDASKEHTIWLKKAIAMVFILYFGLNIYVLTYRSVWFEKSAELNQTLLEQLGQEVDNLKTDTKVLIADLPDHTQYTFTFRNTFPSATKLLQYHIDVVPILNSELVEIPPQQQQDYVNRIAQETNCDIVFWYSNGKLVIRQ